MRWPNGQHHCLSLSTSQVRLTCWVHIFFAFNYFFEVTNPLNLQRLQLQIFLVLARKPSSIAPSLHVQLTTENKKISAPEGENNSTTNPAVVELNALGQESPSQNNTDIEPNEFMFNPEMDERIIHQIEFREK